MSAPSQLPLPFVSDPRLTRAALIVSEGNAQAVRFIDAWPDWPAPAAALYGPPGSGKTHLAAIWSKAAAAVPIPAARLGELNADALAARGAMVIEDVDLVEASLARDHILFALLEGAIAGRAVLLTGRTPPSQWPVALPDLASRFSALLAFPLWAPDEAVIAALARKLFADRQLVVPDAVIARITHSLERSPAAVRAFVDEADAKALAENRPVNLALVRELLATRESGGVD